MMQFYRQCLELNKFYVTLISKTDALNHSYYSKTIGKVVFRLNLLRTSGGGYIIPMIGPDRVLGSASKPFSIPSADGIF